MKTLRNWSGGGFGLAAAVAGALATSAAQGAPTFTNGDFQGNGADYNTGYNTFKRPIANWSTPGGGESGIMYYLSGSSGDAYTANTGSADDFVGMRSGGSIQQTVSGFTVGQNYVIQLDGNSRLGEGNAFENIDVGGHTVMRNVIYANTGSFLSYTSRPFTATSGSMTVTLSAPTAYTALLDNLQILSTANPVVPFAFNSNFEEVLAYSAGHLGMGDGNQNVVFTSSGGEKSLRDPTAFIGSGAYEGTKVLLMQGKGTATLTLRELTPGAQYDVSFWARDRFGGGSANDFQVKVDGNVLLGGVGYTVPAGVWTRQLLYFTAGGSTASLTFETLVTGGGDKTVVFDFVQIPEPASLTLLALGGLVGLRRRRRA